MRHTHEVEATGQRSVHWLRAAAFVVGIVALAWMCSVLFATAAEAAAPADGSDRAGDVLPLVASTARDVAPPVREATGPAPRVIQKVTRPVEQEVQRTVRRAAAPERTTEKTALAPVAQPAPREPSAPSPDRDAAAPRETRPQAQRPSPLGTLVGTATEPVRVTTADVRDRTATVVRTTLETVSPTLREVAGVAEVPGVPAVPGAPEVPGVDDLTELLPVAVAPLAPQPQVSSELGGPGSAETASADPARGISSTSPRSTEDPSAPATSAVDAAASGGSTYDAGVPLAAPEGEREAPSLPTIPATSGAFAAAPGTAQGGGQSGGQSGAATLPTALFLPATAGPDQASTRLASSLPEPGSRPGASPD